VKRAVGPTFRDAFAGVLPPADIDAAYAVMAALQRRAAADADAKAHAAAATAGGFGLLKCLPLRRTATAGDGAAAVALALVLDADAPTVHSRLTADIERGPASGTTATFTSNAGVLGPGRLVISDMLFPIPEMAPLQ
jgi:hypothetical protein